MYEHCRHASYLSLVFVWLNSSVLFTWEINLRPYDGYYPPTDTWANTQILYGHKPAGARARRQIQEHMFAGMQYKHTQCACARSTYLHTLIENRQTYSPTCHINTIYAYFLAWNVRPHTWMYACYLIIIGIINGTLACTVKKLFSHMFDSPNNTAARDPVNAIVSIVSVNSTLSVPM